MNAQTKHTPWPWEFLPETAEHRARIVDRNGELVTYIDQSRYGDNRNDPEAQSNARLIAAAPELLEALRDVLRIATAASIGVIGNAPRLERARAAIKRATGEQP